MADDIPVTPGQVTDPKVATDDIGGKHYQKVKFGWGIDGAWNETGDTDGIRIPIGGGQIGALNETAPTTDIASSGLNGRLQRIAQRITSMIAQLPATLGTKTAANALPVTLASDEPQNILIGALAETAPTNDTNASGLNGRLQRIAQTLTSILNRVPPLSGLGGIYTASSSVAVFASVAAGATLQAAGSDLDGVTNWGIMVPSSFDGTQIQFQMSNTLAGTYVPCYDITGQRVVVPAAASRYIDVPGELMAIRFLKIECVTVQAATSTDFWIIGKS